MMIQSSRNINTNALRMMPYAILVRALISCFVLISIGTASLRAAGADVRTNDLLISISLLGILAAVGYAFAIYCLCGLQDHSDKFRTAMILLVISVIACSVGILARSESIYQRAYEHQQAAMYLEHAANIVHITEIFVYVTAVLVIMKGLAEMLNGTGDNRRFAKSLELIGAIYIASVAIPHIVIFIAHANESGITASFLHASLLIWVLLEIVIFFAQRKAVLLIWKDLCDKNAASQGIPQQGRG